MWFHGSYVCNPFRCAEELARYRQQKVHVTDVRQRCRLAARGAQSAQPAAQHPQRSTRVRIERQINWKSGLSCSQATTHLKHPHLERAARTATARAGGCRHTHACQLQVNQTKHACLPHLSDGACSSQSIARCSVAVASTCASQSRVSAAPAQCTRHGRTSSMAASTRSAGGWPMLGPSSASASVSGASGRGALLV